MVAKVAPYNSTKVKHAPTRSKGTKKVTIGVLNQMYISLPSRFSGEYNVSFSGNEIHLTYADIDCTNRKRIMNNRLRIAYNMDLVGEYEIEEIDRDNIILTKLK